jgi:hypothetical protein
VIVGALTLLALLRLPRTQRSPWNEAAVIAVAVCAVNLGEVLLELPAALALGMAACHVQRMRAAPPQADVPTPGLGSLTTVRLR